MEHSIQTEREIDRVRRESLLLRRKEAIEIHAMVNHAIHRSSDFSVFWGLQVPVTQTQNPHTPLDTQVTAGGIAGGGQEGVLDLRRMEWRPVERNGRATVRYVMTRGGGTAQQSANANENGSLQGANKQASGCSSRTRGVREDGQEGELGLNRAALERVVQRALDEMARRGQ